MSLEYAENPRIPGTAGTPRATVERLATPAVYLGLGMVALLPLLMTAVPPLVDYPNHLARMAVLANDGTSALAQNYVADWRLLPNLAMDLVVPTLAQVMPLEIAGRVFIGGTMALLVFATAALHRALFGRVGLWPLAALLFLYNAVLWWGFLNYLFGLGVALLVFAGWVASERWRVLPRVLVFAGAAAVILVLHLFAFGVYGLLVAGYELGRRVPIAALGQRMLQFMPAGLLWLLSLDNGGPSFTRYGALEQKAYAAVSPFAFDAPPAALDVAILAFAVGFLALAARRNALSIAPTMRLPLAAAIVAAAAMPNWLFGSWGADLRLPVAIAFLAVAATSPRLSPRAWRLAGIAAFALLAVRVATVSAAWREMDERVGEFHGAAAHLPEGARLLVVANALPPDQGGWPARQQFDHLPALAVFDRGAFIPYLFTGWTSIRATERNAGLFATQGGPLDPAVLATPDGPAYAARWPEHFDFVLWIDFGRPPATVPAPLEPWSGGSFFTFYRVAQRHEGTSP